MLIYLNAMNEAVVIIFDFAEFEEIFRAFSEVNENYEFERNKQLKRIEEE